MIKAQIVPATQEHIDAMLPHVRQADVDKFGNKRRELSAAQPQVRIAHVDLPVPVLLMVKCTIWRGAGITIGGNGIPWLVGTDALEKLPHFPAARKVVNAMLAVYLGILKTMLMPATTQRIHVTVGIHH